MNTCRRLSHEGELSYLMTNTRLLQEILLHTSAVDHSVFIEEDFQIFPKAAGVVVADCFSVSKGWKRQDGSGLFVVHLNPVPVVFWTAPVKYSTF